VCYTSKELLNFFKFIKAEIWGNKWQWILIVDPLSHGGVLIRRGIDFSLLSPTCTEEKPCKDTERQLSVGQEENSLQNSTLLAP
jgi:hypothetical protein